MLFYIFFCISELLQKVLVSNKTLVDINLSCNTIGPVSFSYRYFISVLRTFS